jgi:hypothetical protein
MTEAAACWIKAVSDELSVTLEKENCLEFVLIL